MKKLFGTNITANLQTFGAQVQAQVSDFASAHGVHVPRTMSASPSSTGKKGEIDHPNSDESQVYSSNGSGSAQLDSQTERPPYNPQHVSSVGGSLTADEAHELRRQVVELKVKNNMLRQELEDTQSSAEEVSRLKAALQLLQKQQHPDATVQVPSSDSDDKKELELLREENKRLRMEMAEQAAQLTSKGSQLQDDIQQLQQQVVHAQQQLLLTTPGAEAAGPEGSISELQSQLHSSCKMAHHDQQVKELQASVQLALESKVQSTDRELAEAYEQLTLLRVNADDSKGTFQDVETQLRGQLVATFKEVESLKLKLADSEAAYLVATQELKLAAAAAATAQDAAVKLAAAATAQDAAVKLAAAATVQDAAVKLAAAATAQDAAVKLADGAERQPALGTSPDDDVMGTGTGRTMITATVCSECEGSRETLRVAQDKAKEAELKLTVLVKQVQELEARLTSEAAAAEAARKEVEKVEQKRAELAADLHVTTRKLNGATERIVLMTEEHLEAEAVLRKYDELEEELDNRQKRAEEAEQKLIEAEGLVAVLRTELHESTSQIAQTQEAYEALRERLEAFSLKKMEMEATIHSLQAELAESKKMEATIQSLQAELAENKKMEATIHSLQAELAESKEKEVIIRSSLTSAKGATCNAVDSGDNAAGVLVYDGNRTMTPTKNLSTTAANAAQEGSPEPSEALHRALEEARAEAASLRARIRALSPNNSFGGAPGPDYATAASGLREVLDGGGGGGAGATAVGHEPDVPVAMIRTGPQCTQTLIEVDNTMLIAEGTQTTESLLRVRQQQKQQSSQTDSSQVQHQQSSQTDSSQMQHQQSSQTDSSQVQQEQQQTGCQTELTLQCQQGAAPGQAAVLDTSTDTGLAMSLIGVGACVEASEREELSRLVDQLTANLEAAQNLLAIQAHQLEQLQQQQQQQTWGSQLNSAGGSYENVGAATCNFLPASSDPSLSATNALTSVEQQQLRTLEEESQVLKQQLSEMRSNTASISSGGNAEDMLLLQQQRQALEEERAALKQQIQVLTEKQQQQQPGLKVPDQLSEDAQVAQLWRQLSVQDRQHRQMKKEAEHHLQLVQSHLDQARELQSTTEAARVNLDHQLTELTRKYAALEKHRAELAGRLEVVTDQLKVSEDREKVVHDRLCHAEKGLEAARVSVASLEAQLSASQAVLPGREIQQRAMEQELRQQLEAAQRLATEAQSSLQKVERQLKEEMQARATLQERLEESSHKLEEEMQARAALQERLEESSHKLEEEMQARAALQERLEESSHKLEEEMQAKAALQERLEERSHKLEELLEQSAAFEEQLQAAQQQLLLAEEEGSRLVLEQQEAVRRRDSAEARCQDLEGCLIREGGQHQEALEERDMRIAYLEKSLGSVDSEVRLLQTSLESAGKNVAEKVAQIMELKAQLAEVEEASRQSVLVEVQGLEKEVAELREWREHPVASEASEENDKILEAQINVVREEGDRKLAESEESRQQLQERLDAAVGLLQATSQQLSCFQADAEERAASSQAAWNAAKEDILSLNMEREMLQEQLQEAAVKLHNAQEQMAVQVAEAAASMSGLRVRYEAQIQKLQFDLAQTSAAAAEAEVGVAAAQQELSSMALSHQATMQQLETQLRYGQGLMAEEKLDGCVEVDELRAALEEAERKLQDMQEALDKAICVRPAVMSSGMEVVADLESETLGSRKTTAVADPKDLMDLLDLGSVAACAVTTTNSIAGCPADESSPGDTQAAGAAAAAGRDPHTLRSPEEVARYPLAPSPASTPAHPGNSHPTTLIIQSAEAAERQTVSSAVAGSTVVSAGTSSETTPHGLLPAFEGVAVDDGGFKEQHGRSADDEVGDSSPVVPAAAPAHLVSSNEYPEESIISPQVEELKLQVEELRKELESKASEVTSLTSQLEEMGDTLSKINNRYQRQFERYEADQTANMEALRRQHKEAEEQMRHLHVEAEEKVRKELTADNGKLQKQVSALEASLGDVIRRGEGQALEASSLRDMVRQLKEESAERVDRLQKINKKLSSDKDDLTAQLTAVTHRLTASEASEKEKKDQIKQLQAKVTELQAATGELTALKKKLERVEGQLKATEGLKASLAVAEQERNHLRDKVPSLQQSAEEAAALKVKVKELEVQSRGLEETKRRLEAAEAERDRSVSEVARCNAMLTNLEARLQQVEDDNETLSTALEQERRRQALTGSSGAGGGGGTWGGAPLVDPPLGDLSLMPRERWPPAVRRLVEQAERAALLDAGAKSRHGGSSSSSSSRASDGESGDVIEVPVATVQEIAAGEEIARLEKQCVESELKVSSLQQQVLYLEAELEKLKESALQADTEARQALHAARSSWESRQRAEAEEAREMVEEAERRFQEASKRESTWKERCLRTEEELQTLRDRSRLLLEQSEAKVERLQAVVRQQQQHQQQPGQSKVDTLGALATAVSPLEANISGSVRAQAGPLGYGGGGILSQPSSSAAASLIRSASSSSSSSGDQQHVLLALKKQVEEFRAAYEESERTHRLRDQSDTALKEEVAKQKALAQLSDADMVYLRGVLVSAFESGAISKEGPMFMVLSRLLKLTPQELARISTGKQVSGTSSNQQGRLTKADSGLQRGGTGTAGSTTNPLASVLNFTRTSTSFKG
ncbi:hypothetical protein CEUSTIGMA_g5729.t1 [Chlamydomonas eustigma]|uniref:GRIP domain-containing protein n=1 Tax=Chlamydomonas eustigma TaxID=1157962 RepID=A0A250X5B7_9CHLO|nr:hypothetical protein CEUSTIGMA_g5729.t1 [Chlamydomonas eustigma]|eukprot:GAX78287.1 hypothetical protein CEUSTIGMA_g5729.t1 [Chlamydomonas eustigma]